VNDRNTLVEETQQTANDARLSLSSFAEEHHVMARKNGVFYFGNDGLIVTDDPWKYALAVFQMAHQIFPHFLTPRQN